ncbi:hypothetical protein [Thalassovita sp.]|uniref:hypothetical protein n=1 Tax=Thalassovita sp. TaxID=1979401 RepID=UPI002AB0F573|nr:hypothetical protein [Thalassovita sp.]
MLLFISSFASAIVIATALFTALVDRPTGLRSWLLPAATSALFLAGSLVAVWVEGPMGFIKDMDASLWAVQIWVDLMLGFAVAFTAMLAEARRLDMAPFRWALLLCVLGAIGLLAMQARLLYLRARAS